MQKLKIFFAVVKKLLSPLQFNKKISVAYLISLMYESIYTIFLIQLGAAIISAIEQKDIQLFYRYLIFFIIIQILLVGKNWLGSWSRTHINVYARTFLNKIYLQKYINADNNQIESFGTGRMNNIIFSGVNRWIQILISGILPAITGFLAMIYGFVIIAISVSFPIFLIFLGVFLLGTFIVLMSFIKTTKYRKIAKQIDIILDRRKIKILMSKFEIFQNNKFSSESRFLDTQTHSLFDTWRRHSIVRLQWETSYWTLASLGRILLYLIFGIGIIHGNYSISYLVLLIGLFGRVTNYIYRIKSYTKEIARSIVHVEKLWDVMEHLPVIERSGKMKKFILKHGDISIQNIGFSYGENEEIFKDFSLDIQGGKKTAFVGESGSGKSTLIKLIAGYLHAEKGKLLVDGQSLKDVSLQTYYKHIGYLTQEPSVFDGTIMENLTYALKKKPSNAQLNKIIKAAKCEFITKFKKGLNTEIGERGIRLSGGQKQRLAIAKIMLKDPEIILLDEPTSALDSLSEQKVAEALHNLFQGRTVIVIAHRLQTVKEADDIIVLSHGKVVERGTHRQLERKNGIYKKMLDLQSTF